MISALVFLISIMLFFTVELLSSKRQSYFQIFTNTLVTVRFSEGLGLGTARQIAHSEYVSDSYYEASGIVETDFRLVDTGFAHDIAFTFTNNIARFVREEIDISYAEGYDETWMYRLGDTSEIVFVGKDYLDERGLRLGDKLIISRKGLARDVISAYIDGFVVPEGYDINNKAHNAMINAYFLEIYGDRITDDINELSNVFTIAGMVSTSSESFNSMVFSPWSRSAASLGFATVDMAEYTVADNDFIDDFREYCERRTGGSVTGSTSMRIETSKIENIRNSIRIMDALYPIIVGAALLIGAFLCSLIILQSVKEAALLRALGVTKMKTRIILSLGQILLCFVGLLVGAGIMLVYKGADIAAIVKPLGIFAALYFVVVLASAATCSVLATRRSILELLQTKE